MNAFSYVRPASIDDALRAARESGTFFIGGGTNLLDLTKSGVEQPDVLIDVNRLGMDRIEALPDGGLRIGASVRNSDAANDEQVRRRYPLLAQALLAGASVQLRNMATMAGNLMQRTRCHYFVDVGFEHCNKRKPGSGCAAREGHNRIHAILGASEQCVAVNPSDMSVALAALDASVRVRGRDGDRSIAFADFHRLPGDDARRDTNLAPGEMILAIDLPPRGFAANSHYEKLRDRASFAFALVSVAAALEIDGGKVHEARIALGGVAHKPWRAHQTERLLIGHALDTAAVNAAAKAAIADAKPLRDNAFKLELVQRAIVRALHTAGGLA